MAHTDSVMSTVQSRSAEVLSDVQLVDGDDSSATVENMPTFFLSHLQDSQELSVERLWMVVLGFTSNDERGHLLMCWDCCIRCIDRFGCQELENGSLEGVLRSFGWRAGEDVEERQCDLRRPGGNLVVVAGTFVSHFRCPEL